MKNLKKAFRGFTLVEVLIVIIIIGILIAALLPRLTGSQARARDNARMAGVNQIANGIALFINDAGSVTTGLNDCLEADAGNIVEGDVNGTTRNLNDYLTTIPQDPQGSHYNGACEGSFNVRTTTDGRAAFVFADLEQEIGANVATGAPSVATITGFQALMEAGGSEGFAVLVRG